MRFLVLFSFIFSIFSASLNAQNPIDKCGSDKLHEHYINTVSGYIEERQLIEKSHQNYKSHNKSSSSIIIPVVFHVIYRTANQNISDATIQSQIDVLNKDYNKMNWDTMKVPSVWKSLIADVGIEFKLANRDPNGNVTTGITRKETTIKNIASISGDVYYQSSKGGQDIWDRNRYLNIWVCEIANGLYGFGSFPGAPAASDGIVIAFNSFGTTGETDTSPTDKGRTATHEVGHWFDLLHPWGYSECGDDLVSDTPIHKEGNFDCKTYPHNTPPCNTTADGEMFMNFMDYSDDNCLNMFTLGQKDRMINTLNTARSSILSSDGYNNIINFEEIPFAIYPSPASDYINVEPGSNLQLNRLELYDLNGVLINYIDVIPNNKKQRINVSALNDGMYIVKLFTSKNVFTEKVLVWHH